MITINKPVKVLVIFEPEKYPVPCKVKGVDNRGNGFTLAVDRILNVEAKALDFIVYNCMSIYENSHKRYVLKYWFKKCLWESEQI